jgi:hypothetical protein
MSWSRGLARDHTHGEEEVGHVLLDGARVCDDLERLVHTLALTREDGLVDAEVARRNGHEAGVCWNLVTDGDRDKVAWHELGGMDAINLTITEDFSFVGRVLLQCLDA